VRTRRVALKGEWWRKDRGSLVAFLADGHRPVALLAGSTYELVDADRGHAGPVNAARARELEPHAYMFYPSLSERGAIWELAVGMRSLRAELRSMVAVAFLSGLLAISLPVALGQLIDSVIPGGDRQQLWAIVLLLLAAAAAQALFELVGDFAKARLDGKLGVGLEAAVWDRLISLPVAFFRSYSAGDLGRRANDLALAKRELVESFASLLQALIHGTLAFVIMLHYGGRLALLGGVLALVFVAAISLAGVIRGRVERTSLELEGRLTGLLVQLLGGISRLRTLGAERRAYWQWATRFSVQRAFVHRSRRIEHAVGSMVHAYPLLATGLVYLAVARRFGPEMSSGAIIAFSALFAGLLTSAASVSEAIGRGLGTLPLFERARPILATLPEADARAAHAGVLSGDIELSQVSFRYQQDGPTILSDVNLHVLPGELVAIVGPSGSGKSTLLRLLLGFEKPTSGSVSYDGRDLDGLEPREVRAQIGVVLQHGQIMAGTVFENIAAAGTATLDQAWRAAKLAALDEDLRALPEGMSTELPQGGSTLSSGQRQRLMIARAVVGEPRMLFFDEATSALDNPTQELVSRGLAELDATRIVIAHRLSTIENADWIYVLDRGRIVDSGSYDELLERSSVFGELVQKQTL
jgi:ATP-binding cassette subfamily C protein